MQLFYYKVPHKNFGDDLNTWLWDEVLPGWQSWAPDHHLVGVGTILNSQILPAGPKLVVGSGAGYGTLPDVTTGHWDIRAVRGPKTCEQLGLPPATAVSDPAIVLPRLARFSDLSRGNETVFIPHIASDNMCDWAKICRSLNLSYQSPSDDPDKVIRRIAGAKNVIAESMHAAIIADAFGTPWRGVRISNNFNGEKWLDWSRSLGTEHIEFQAFFRPLRLLQKGLRAMRSGKTAQRPKGLAAGPLNLLPPKSQRKPLLGAFAYLDLKRAAKGPFVLTDRQKLAQAQDRFFHVFDEIIRDYGPTGRAG